MKPNFPKLRVEYKDSVAAKPIELAFEVSSIDFDINQTTVSPGTPFTSELSFILNLSKVGKPANVGDLNALDKLINDLYDGKNTGITNITKAIQNAMSEGVGLSFNPQPDKTTVAGQVQDLVSQNAAAPMPYFVSVSPQSGDSIDLKAASWLVQVKFLSSLTVGYMSDPDGTGTLLFQPTPSAAYVLHPALNLAINTLSMTEPADGAALNAELQLAYEVLLQPVAANASGVALPNNLTDTIGKVSDELSDSFANLGATLADKLSNTVSARLQPVAGQISYDLALWMVIQKSTYDLSFENYLAFMDEIFCGEPQTALTGNEVMKSKVKALSKYRATPFMGVDAYQSVKVATEAFVMVNCMADDVFDDEALANLNKNVPLVNGVPDTKKLDEWWSEYRKDVNGAGEIIPYLAIIQKKLQDSGFKLNSFDAALQQYLDPKDTYTADKCFGVIYQKLVAPCFLELIWSYWHEESMMVQGLNAIGRRFQNIKGPGPVDPLANMEIDPLRPLSNLMWGYIQDEQHRLTVRRRAFEYDHHYGISLQGAAVQNMRFADSRSKFIEAFHMLLHLTNKFYKQADDMTVQPDGFPILNALKEVHLVLSEGAHNQYGDLPSVARAEMLLQQWMLARPEFREFLPTRLMVAYPERWMDRVSGMNNLMGWTKTSVLHFRDLGVFGEQLLLSIRFGNWANVVDRFSASNWANFWRPQIQAYIHAYRAATGVDLTADVPGTRIDSMQPSVHLQRRLLEQRGKAA